VSRLDYGPPTLTSRVKHIYTIYAMAALRETHSTSEKGNGLQEARTLARIWTPGADEELTSTAGGITRGLQPFQSY